MAALCTILPFASARAGGMWPETPLWPYAVIVALATALTGAALLGTARRAIRGPALL